MKPDRHTATNRIQRTKAVVYLFMLLLVLSAVTLNWLLASLEMVPLMDYLAVITPAITFSLMTYLAFILFRSLKV